MQYDIKKEDLNIDPFRVAEILYSNAPFETLREKMTNIIFQQTLNRIKEGYFHMMDPYALTRNIDVKLFRDIFCESLPIGSPIYEAADAWKKAALFVVTIGCACEMSVKTLLDKGNLYESLFLDACCSVMADDLADKVQWLWEKETSDSLSYKLNLYSTRYSPGYCLWDVKGQFALFGYLADENIPVTLNEAAMMFPQKSLTGVVVIEEPDPSSSLVASCRMCESKCKYMRRASY